MPDHLSRVTDLLTRATRFFARIHGSFDCECPACGQLVRVAGVTGPRPKQADRAAVAYDARTATFRCPSCNKAYTVGLVFWPRAGHGVKLGLPLDQIPNLRQAQELRREGGGWWLPDDAAVKSSPVHESNLAVEPERMAVEDLADEDELPADPSVKLRFRGQEN